MRQRVRALQTAILLASSANSMRNVSLEFYPQRRLPALSKIGFKVAALHYGVFSSCLSCYRYDEAALSPSIYRMQILFSTDCTRRVHIVQLRVTLCTGFMWTGLRYPFRRYPWTDYGEGEIGQEMIYTTLVLALEKTTEHSGLGEEIIGRTQEEVTYVPVPQSAVSWNDGALT